jgi:hypothetical protein
MQVEYLGATYHLVDRGERREDTLLIGTAQAANSLLHHLTHGPSIIPPG